MIRLDHAIEAVAGRGLGLTASYEERPEPSPPLDDGRARSRPELAIHLRRTEWRPEDT
jgi:hypothetical protein